MEKNFVKVRSTKDIVVSLLIIMLGFGLMTLPDSEPINITGYFVVTGGFILIFVLKSAYKDMTTGEIYSKKERYFAQAKHDQLMQSLTCPNRFSTKGENQGSTLRLDVYYNNQKILIQLMEYVPFTYEPCTRFYEHDILTGSKFIHS